MMKVKIVRSSPGSWYHNLQYKNNKQKTFLVRPSTDGKSFEVMEGEKIGNVIDPKDVSIDPLEALNSVQLGYTLQDIVDAVQYGFDYRTESQNDGKRVPLGNTLQWLMAKRI